MITKHTPPEPDTGKQLERRRVRNRKIGAFAGAAAILAGAVVTIVAIQPDATVAPPPAPPTSPSESSSIGFATNSYLDIVTGDRTPVAADLTGASLPEVSPNGESVVYFTFESDDLYVAALDGSGETTITLDGLSGDAATWIDDETLLFQGRPIGSGSNAVGDLYAVDVSTGEVTMVTDLALETHGAWFIVSDVSPDGTTVLFHLPRGKGSKIGYDLWTAPIAGGEATLLREDAGFAQFGPDGSIVFLDRPVSWASDAIWIMDGDGRHARVLVDGGHYTTWPRFSPDGARVSYANEETIEIVEVKSGDVTTLDASTHEQDPAWYDADTLIVD